MDERRLNYNDVLEIIELVKGADEFANVRLRYDGVEIELSKRGHVAAVPARDASAVSPEHPAVEPASPAEAQQHATSALPASSLAAVDAPAEGLAVIRAPMVGTFYRAPEPGASPFVEVGGKVAAHETVCIIEVMKLMNTLSTDVAGVVRDVLVADGQTVEYGQPLIVIEPDR